MELHVYCISLYSLKYLKKLVYEDHFNVVADRCMLTRTFTMLIIIPAPGFHEKVWFHLQCIFWILAHLDVLLFLFLQTQKTLLHLHQNQLEVRKMISPKYFHQTIIL